jgi:hypothetical protein
LIGGDDTDHHFTSLGDSYIREGFNFLGTHVTNGNTLAVCIGCNGGLAEASFRQAFDVSQLPAAGWTREILTNSVYILEFFDNTGTVKIQDAGIIYLPSGGELPDNGGITQAQLDVVNTNRIILNDFVKDQDTGGGRYTIAENALAFVPSMRSALTAGSCGGPFEAIFILDVSGSITSEEFSAERDCLLNCLCGADSIPADGTVAVSRGRPVSGEHGALSAVLL